MQAFKFNEHGICEKPKWETIFEDKKFVCKISLVEKDGRWAYGYNFQIKGVSVGCFGAGAYPGFNEYRKGYSSRDDAREAVIDLGIGMFRRADNRFNTKPVIKALKCALTPQLELF